MKSTCHSFSDVCFFIEVVQLVLSVTNPEWLKWLYAYTDKLMTIVKALGKNVSSNFIYSLLFNKLFVIRYKDIFSFFFVFVALLSDVDKLRSLSYI